MAKAQWRLYLVWTSIKFKPLRKPQQGTVFAKWPTTMLRVKLWFQVQKRLLTGRQSLLRKLVLSALFYCLSVPLSIVP